MDNLKMQLRHMPAKTGYLWFCQGLWIFRINPIGFLMLIFLYILLVQVAFFFPELGLLFILIFTPGISLGFMAACRAALAQERPRLTLFIDSYRHYGSQTSKRLLGLGLIYTLAVLSISLITYLFIDFPVLALAITQQQAPSAEAMQQLYIAAIVVMVLYLPIMMVMWFAPLLIAWQHMSVIKALFFSWLACWHNRGAFMLYLILWAAALIVLPLAVDTLLLHFDLANIAGFIVTPYSIIMMAMLYCSFYATWKGCFQEITSHHDDVLPSP